MKLTNNFNAHQGDTQWYSVEELPKTAKKINKTFIAKSEKSGHVHALCGDYEMYSDDTLDGFLIKVNSDGATLNHTKECNLSAEILNNNKVTEIADHKPLILKRGIYAVGIQRKKQHFSKIWEEVKD